MENIGLIEIIMIVTIILLLYFFFKEFNRRKYLGEFIFKAPREKDSKVYLIFWIIMLCFWIVFFMEACSSIGEGYYSRPFLRISNSGFFIFFSIYNILRYMNSQEIRQKGMTSMEGFLYWKHIIDYRWITDKELEITFQLKFLFSLKWKKRKVLMIQDEFKNEINQVLDNYY